MKEENKPTEDLKVYETTETQDFEIEDAPSIKKENFFKKHLSKIQIGLIILFIALTLFSELLFPGSAFAEIVENSLGQFFDITSLLVNNYLTILESLGILIFIWSLNKVLQLLVDVLTRSKAKNVTAIALLKSAIKWTLYLIGAFLILTAWGVNSTTLFASVGIFGLLISFGAQSLVEDVISGLFLIIEKQFAVGEIVIIGDYRGVVKEIGLRTTKIVDALNFDLKIINNSDIRNIINASQNLSTAVCDMSIEYSQSIPDAEKLIESYLPKIAKKHKDVIVDGPIYVGVQELGDSAVNLRITAKTLETDRAKVQRILNRELKILFDENNISIPFPQLVIHKSE
jgi:small conductance mechanosensitive channel